MRMDASASADPHVDTRLKAAAPFMHSHSRYQCGCITITNPISAEAVMWLLLCGCVCISNALLT